MKIFRKKSIIVISTLLILVGSLCWWQGIGFFKEDVNSVAWITDIHADRFKRRDVDSGRLYPRKYKDYLPKVFDILREKKIRTVIATGDNTNSGDDNYARDILKIAKEKRMDMIWVKGNHDNDEVMDILGVEKNYYFRDIGKTRIIVLDTTEYSGGKYDYHGGISQDQLEWIKNTIDVEKEVIVAMHMPMFFRRRTFRAL
jgi:3',5'-cyclic AMP phosphodiesterase CpdA